MDKQIIILLGKPPQLTGDWKIGEIRAAGQFLIDWIDAQQISPLPPTKNQATGTEKHK